MEASVETEALAGRIKDILCERSERLSKNVARRLHLPRRKLVLC